MRHICSFQKNKMSWKKTLNVRLPMCDTLAFSKLSLVKGFHLAFVQRIQIIFWTFYYMIMGCSEVSCSECLLGINFGGCEICHVAESKVTWVVSMSSLYSCDVTSRMIFCWWVQYSITGRRSETTDYLLAHFLLCLGMWLCCDVTDVC